MSFKKDEPVWFQFDSTSDALLAVRIVRRRRDGKWHIKLPDTAMIRAFYGTDLFVEAEWLRPMSVVDRLAELA